MNPDSVQGWLSLAARHEVAARKLAEDKVASAEGYFHAGLAVECTLKAYIMHMERLNAWPSRDARPELYTHDLRELRRIAGILLDARDPTAPAWHLALQWDRGQGYDPNPMPRKVARAMIEAAFGANGVVTWMRQRLT